MIIVVATIQLAEGQLDAFLVELRKVVPQVLAEDGCLEYQPTVDASTEIDVQDAPSQERMTIVERWESLESLERHLIAPHMVAYRTRVKELVCGVSLQILQPV